MYPALCNLTNSQITSNKIFKSSWCYFNFLFFSFLLLLFSSFLLLLFLTNIHCFKFSSILLLDFSIKSDIILPTFNAIEKSHGIIFSLLLLFSSFFVGYFFLLFTLSLFLLTYTSFQWFSRKEIIKNFLSDFFSSILKIFKYFLQNLNQDIFYFRSHHFTTTIFLANLFE